jgi:hypothetical protein
MPSTYEPIATTTLGSDQATVDLTSIPSTYTDLILILSGGVTIDNSIHLRFNSDTASNYSFTELYGTGSGAYSARSSNNTIIGLTDAINSNLSTGKMNIIAQIFNYTNTTTYKTLISRYNDAGSQTGANVGLWRKTPEAINSITLRANTYNASNKIASGTTITLYGIKAA